ncbi:MULTISPECIES: cytochrome-c peroxidase [Pseudoalteromonas]|uniref:Cytochrome-c peroxidase n=1 Tax=Pseudoalteromonas amylolytica TaxID=1859457 RepID=A0A1S1MTC0_9GAMM|nr:MULTISPECIES: cytochrome c peroxidase [Pseudoalteromonas]OHU86799.1 cytochrome-c peroxidase [Pseudoalteromonas sp. JW3]OHU88676.1 cytochrome-c peroxidase [Pseudoalteromonas amylolytica]
MNNVKFARVIVLTAVLSALQVSALEAKPKPKHPPRQQQIASPLDLELSALAAQHGLTGRVEGAQQLPRISDPIAQLGMQLFFTKALGGEKTVACASCHDPRLGGADGLSLPIGTNAVDSDVVGPGRQAINDEINIPRNSPTIFNSGFASHALFWDGRVERVVTTDEQGNEISFISTPDSGFNQPDEQAGNTLVSTLARFPVTSREEMRGQAFETATTNDQVRAHLAERIGDYGSEQGSLPTNDWLQAFREAFNSQDDAQSLITFDNIAFALGQYQSSFVMVDTDWHRYVRGDLNALTEQQKQGAKLFFTQISDGGAGCVNCHSGERFTNDGFFNLAFPQYGIGTDENHADIGRAAIDPQPRNQFAFRVPSLINVALTAPYSHAGAYESLAQVVSHYSNPEQTVEQFFQSGGACGLKQFALSAQCETLNQHSRENTDAALSLLRTSPFVAANLAPQQQQDLVAFLHALTDKCAKDRECVRRWIPNRHTPDPDNLRLRAPRRTGG